MKAIVIVDMPDSCKKCPLKYFDTGDDAYFGGGTERCVIDGSEISLSGRYDDCPLRPLPKRKKHNLGNEDEYEVGSVDGWNYCLDEILGEDND